LVRDREALQAQLLGVHAGASDGLATEVATRQ